MPDYREMDDGTRWFPPRGTPPAGMPGYVQDPGNPYIFKPEMSPCELRVEQEIPICGDCGRTIKSWACKSGEKAGFKQCGQCVATGRREQLVTEIRLSSDSASGSLVTVNQGK